MVDINGLFPNGFGNTDQGDDSEATAKPTMLDGIISDASTLAHMEMDTGPVTLDENKAGHLETVAMGGMNTLKNLDRVFGTPESNNNMKDLVKLQPEARYDSYEDIESFGDVAGFALQEAELQIANMMGLVTMGGAGGSLGLAGGSTAGTVSGLLPMHLGESLTAMDEAGVKDATVGKALAPALVNTTVDAVGLRKMGSLLGLSKYLGFEQKARKALSKTFVRRVGKGVADVAGVAAIEGSTEVFQDNLNGVWAQLMADKDFKEALDKGLMSGDENLNTFIKGSLGSMPFAAGAKIIAPREEFLEEPVNGKVDKEDPEIDPDQPDIRPMAPEVPEGDTPTPPVDVPQDNIPPVDVPPAKEEPQDEVPETDVPLEELFPELKPEEEVPNRPEDLQEEEPLYKTPPEDEPGVFTPEDELAIMEKLGKIQDKDYIVVKNPLEDNEALDPIYTVIDLEDAKDEKTLEADLQDLASDVARMEKESKYSAPTGLSFLRGKIAAALKAFAKGLPLRYKLRTKDGKIDYQDLNFSLYKTTNGTRRAQEILQEKGNGVFSSLGTSHNKEADKVFTADFIESLEQMATTIADKYFPDVKVFLNANLMKEATGADHIAFTHEGQNLSVINLNTNSNIVNAATKDGTATIEEAQETVKTFMLHELAHALVANRLGAMPRGVRKALVKEYMTMLTGIRDDMTFREFLQHRYGANMYNHTVAVTPDVILDLPMREVIEKRMNPDSVEYALDMEEFFAERVSEEFARAEVSEKSNVQGFFKKIVEDLKEFLRMNVPQGMRSNVYRDVLSVVRRQVSLEKAYAEKGLLPDKAPILKELLGIDNIIQLPPTKLWHDNYNKFMEEYGGILETKKSQEIEFDKEYRISTGFRKWSTFFGWGARPGAKLLLSPSQIARRYKFPQAIQYMESVRKYWATKMAGIGRAENLAAQWRRLSAAQEERLGAYLYELSEESDRLGRRLTEQELRILQEDYQLAPDMIEIATGIGQSFQEVLGRTRYAAQKDVMRLFVHDPDAFLAGYNREMSPEQRNHYVMTWVAEDQNMAAEIIMNLGAIAKQYAELENRNYFPRMRFGRWMVVLKEENESGVEKVVDFQTFESEADYKSMLLRQQRLHDNDEINVYGRTMDETAQSLWGMPQVVVDKVADSLRKEGTLTAEQEDILTAISLDLSPGRRHMKQMKARMNVKGYSRDALRTYASYMSNASNHLARIEHIHDMTESLKKVKEASKGFIGDTQDLTDAANYYQEHFKYILNPESDFANIRNLGFLWYLGFNVKSAVVNLSQLPMVTYPWLASRFGDKKAIAQLTIAAKDITKHVTTNASLSAQEQAMLDQLVKEGVIDESFAMELSSLGNTSVLARASKNKGFDRAWSQFTYGAGYLFSTMEKYNRRVNSLAAYRLAVKEHNMNHASAVAFARKSVMQTQFEYAKWDRAEFMRGPASVAFLFMNYTQSFLYTVFNGENTKQGRATAIRMWIVLALVAGLQGLPGAEYLLSIIDSLGTKLYRLAGWKNPKVDARKAMRSFLADTFNPDAADLILHGSSRFGFGSGLLAKHMFNTPMNVDLSGSLSMGAPLQYGRTTTREGYQLKDFLMESTGAIGNAVGSVVEAATTHDPDTWKRVEKALPAAMRNLSKGIRYEVREEESFRGGARFMDVKDQTALNVMQMMGFSGTEINQRREMYGEQMQAALYWNSRRSFFLDEYALAVELRDKEKKADILDAIKDYNDSLTSPSLRKFRITAKERKRSIAQRKRFNRKKENMQATRKREQKLFDEISKMYPNF